MNSFRMKALSLAVLTIAGVSVADSALAACTANADPKTPNGAWANKAAFNGGSVAVAGPGLNSTNCALYTKITSGNSASLATVTDTSPQNETRYRFRFYLDQTALIPYGDFAGVQIATVASATTYPAVNGRRNVMTISLVPSSVSGQSRLTFSIACNNPGSLNRCIFTPAVDLTPTVNTIEVDMPFSSAAGTPVNIRYWLNAAPGSTDATPATATFSVDNFGWSVKQFSFGLAGPTTGASGFTGLHSGANFIVDEFDSRRQTYIGP